MMKEIFMGEKNLIKIIILIFLMIFPLYSSGKENFISRNELKQLEESGHINNFGKNQWKTKGGLILKGKDPDGFTRLEHIMRHSKNMENRKIHGVFTISKGEIIDLMDLVWEKIKTGSMKEKPRGGKVAYTYKANRVIGYMGGREGKEKNYPKLYSVRLVLTEKTPNVITFFPQ